MFDIRRREFIALVSTAAAAAWPAVVRAAAKRPRVAVLTLLSPQDPGGRTTAFVAGIRELGYIPGQTVDFDYRHAYGDTERLRPLAKELIALAPDVVFAEEPSAARAVKALAPDLPIVCPALTDRLPDLFASYARPGGSVTGVASMVEDLNTKLVELAQEIVPGLNLIGLSRCFRNIYRAVYRSNKYIVVEYCLHQTRTRAQRSVLERLGAFR